MLEEPPRRIRVAFHELPELPRGELQAFERRLGRDGCRALALSDQRQLAEMIARAESRNALTPDVDRGLSRGDDEEADAAHLALVNNGGAGLEASGPPCAGELAQLSPVEPAQEAHSLECRDVCPDRPILPPAGREAER